MREDVETFSMVFAEAELLDGLPMLLRSISFIVMPMIMRKFFMHAPHVVVAIGFGKNTRRGDGRVEGVAFYDTLIWNLL